MNPAHRCNLRVLRFVSFQTSEREEREECISIVEADLASSLPVYSPSRKSLFRNSSLQSKFPHRKKKIITSSVSDSSSFWFDQPHFATASTSNLLFFFPLQFFIHFLTSTPPSDFPRKGLPRISLLIVFFFLPRSYQVARSQWEDTRYWHFSCCLWFCLIAPMLPLLGSSESWLLQIQKTMKLLQQQQRWVFFFSFASLSLNSFISL